MKQYYSLALSSPKEGDDTSELRPIQRIPFRRDELARNVFLEIVNPGNQNPYWKTNLGKVQLGVIRYVLGEFVRKRFPGKFKDYELCFEFAPTRGKERENGKKLQQYILAETDLWLAIWPILNQLYTCGGHHPAITLHALLQEPNGLLMPNFCFIPDGGQSGVTYTIQRIQSENRKLQSSQGKTDNPFNKELQPKTYEFVNNAIALSEDSSSEGRKEWMRVIEARMKFVTLMKEQKHRAHLEDGSTVKAGRPKK